MLDIQWTPIKVQQVITDRFRAFSLFIVAILIVIIVLNAK
ncbi:hypothetical protein Desor_3447 [Desulfosporosinus orientis DSM 765]|uniref:Uncharacterized protein n=1 Tax=Desulfosporosinus orientis (strain ATCC 19365 / DSM 765 / NCIMB 8382 / VKM B-1628 / Singapore I) TaxID=768706 RepID=G7WFR9_DESOD|nr:hypothetical protein Desor_3447 [Desulfosporosinus orientis DSM 765]